MSSSKNKSVTSEENISPFKQNKRALESDLLSAIEKYSLHCAGIQKLQAQTGEFRPLEETLEGSHYLTDVWKFVQLLIHQAFIRKGEV